MKAIRQDQRAVVHSEEDIVQLPREGQIGDRVDVDSRNLWIGDEQILAVSSVRYGRSLEDWFVPAENLIGGEAGKGRGFYFQTCSSTWGRRRSARPPRSIRP